MMSTNHPNPAAVMEANIAALQAQAQGYRELALSLKAQAVQATVEADMLDSKAGQFADALVLLTEAGK